MSLGATRPRLLLRLLPFLATVGLTASCAPDADAPCGTVALCEPGAPCFADLSDCDVAERCANGFEARYYGRSVARDGSCVAATDAACRRSSLSCAVWGQCFAPPVDYIASGSCARRTKDMDYTASRLPGCTGLGTCVALADEDCAASRSCRLAGRCAAQSGVCVAPDEAACRASELCAVAGECSPASDGRCVATASADCEASENCSDLGNCAVRGEGCGPCGRAPVCGAEGLCQARDGRCQATNAAHCRRSAACRSQGRCRLSRGRCVK